MQQSYNQHQNLLEFGNSPFFLCASLFKILGDWLLTGDVQVLPVGRDSQVWFLNGAKDPLQLPAPATSDEHLPNLPGSSILPLDIQAPTGIVV